MKDQVLSIEQMQELIDMGIDVSNASMCWNYNDEKSYWALVINYTHSPYIEGEIVPTFILQDILEILPKPCYINCIDKDFYQCEVTTNYGSSSSNGETPLIAAFNMLKWCKLNNKL